MTEKTDIILKQAQREGQGKLTIFLGAAAGVGKTCAMLKAAHAKIAEGVDVVIGFAMSHGRKETQALMAGLPVIPEKEMLYQGVKMYEMDLDAILERHPQLVIVDELAHTNVAGSRFRYRYNDIDEILKAGIDVYTAVNIQHIESLNDDVARITGTVVKETVPDAVLNRADNIQLIDIPPTELQKRLQEGKVYAPEQAARALKSFFRQGNISALRELALRFTASRVDVDTTEYMRLHDIAGPWPTSGKVMVCASYSPYAAQLIRSGHRLAKGLHSELLVVNVETPTHKFPVGDKERERIWKNFKLAKNLGGKVMTVHGENVAQMLLETARENNVNSIVIGKSRQPNWRDYFRRGLIDKLIANSGAINIYVIRAEAERDNNTIVATGAAKKQKNNMLQEGGMALLMVALITLLMATFADKMELVNIALVYLLPVLISAMWWGRRVSYFTTIVSILAFEYYFIQPTYTFMVEDIRYLWSFAIFFVVASIVGKRTEKLRNEIASTTSREHAINSLYQFSKEITALDNADALINIFVNHVGSNLKRLIFIMLPATENSMKLQAVYDPETNTVDNKAPYLTAEDFTVAVWSYKHVQTAGRSTDTLPTAKYLYLPIVSGGKAVGVIGVDMDRDRLSMEERSLLEAWISMLGMMMQKAAMSERVRQAELLEKSERLRTALLNSVSHELRTPLSGIMGAVYTMRDQRINFNDAMFKQLLNTIVESGVRMERIVTNLLDTARIESGMVKLKVDWCDMEDVISGAIRKWGSYTSKHKFVYEIPDDLPLFKGDCGLLEHVVLNFIDNAAKYSPDAAEIKIKAQASDESITLMVIDSGVGFKDDDKAHLFEKFYRAKCTDQFMGTGLGLSICKNIIEAHEGTIWAEHRKDEQGSIFGFTLPLDKEKTAKPEESNGK